LRKKLLALNLALASLTGYAGFEWRQAWLAAKAREAATLHKKLKPPPPPVVTVPPPVPPVIASGYADIVEKTLFDRSRNPTVVVELPPPPQRPPMPPLPAFHGTLNLGDRDGPIAILSLGAGPEQAVHPGEPIGQFKLLDVNTEEITFEWDGKAVRKKLNELASASPAPQPAAPVRAEGVASPAPAPAALAKTSGPGVDMGGGFKACVPDDPTTPGTIVDGARKVVLPTPFGVMCRWEPVR
jgi:hypothetical protein